MALSPRDALIAAQEILLGARTAEAVRLDRIRDALKPDHCTVVVPNDSNNPIMQRLALKARTNVLPLVVKTFSQVMKVEGYTPARSRDNGAPWAHWQRNGMDARQTGIHRSALAYGVSYALALPGDTGPVIEGFSPRNLTALYQNPNRDEWPMLALEVDGPMMRLYDEEAVYFIGDESAPRSGIVPTIGGIGPRLDYIETRHHDIGFCPVVRYRDRMLLEGEEQYGIVEPIMSIQERIDETTFGMLVAQFYAAFKQRYIIGWVGSEEEEMKASAAHFWTFEDPDVKVGQFTETDLTRYLESKDSAFRDMAAISQVPAQNLGAKGISNISAEALAAMEAGKDREADEITTSLGESHEQLLRLCAYIAGDAQAANDHSAQVRWKNATARSLAQTADALGKMVQMLGVPEEGVWRMIPGVSQADIDSWSSLRQQGDAFSRLDTLLSGQQDRAVTG